MVHGGCGASVCSGKSSRQRRACTVACYGCWGWISGDIFQWSSSAIDFRLPRCASLPLDVRFSCFLIDGLYVYVDVMIVALLFLPFWS